MALKEAGYTDVFGVDTNRDTLAKAKSLGIIKEGCTTGKDIITFMHFNNLCVYKLTDIEKSKWKIDTPLVYFLGHDW